MAVPYPIPKWVDGNFTIASPVSLPVFSSPIPATTKEYVFTQDWIQLRNNFAALPLNTPHSDYSDFLLVNESPRTDMGGGVVKWTRTYAKVPDSYDEFETFGYNLIGFQPDQPYLPADTTLVVGRNREQRALQSRVSFDFYLIDVQKNGTVNPADGRIYPTPGDIPIINAMRYYFVDELEPTRNPTPLLCDFILNIPPNSHPASSPKLSSYKLWCSNALNLAIRWKGDTVDGLDPDNFNPSSSNHYSNPSQFAVEDSLVKRWMGSIWMRTTRTILAQ